MKNKTFVTLLDGLDDLPGVGSYEWSVADNRLSWSAGLMSLFGVNEPPTDEGGFTTLVHPDDRTRVEAELSAFLDSSDSYVHEFRILRPDGAERIIQDRGIVQRDKNGVAITMRGINVDVTEVRLPPPGSLASESRPDGPPVIDEDRRRRASEAAGFSYYDFDVATGRSVWSRELMRIIGHDGGPVSGSIEMALTFVHPDDRARVRAEIDKATRRLGPYDLEYRIWDGSGPVRWVRDRGEMFGPINPETGRARRGTGALDDITRRKAVEQELRSASAVLATIFGSAPVGLGVWDTSFRFTMVNDKLAEINGVPAADHLGKRPDEIVPDLKGLDDLYDKWQEIVDTVQPLLNHELRGATPANPDRQRVWREHFYPVVVDKDVVGIAGIIEDVTDQKAAEQTLKGHADQLRRILDGNIGFIGILDPDGTLREANATALAAGGVGRDEVIGRKFWDAYWWSFDDAVAARLKKAIAAARTGETVRYDTEVRMRGGRRITIDFQLSPVLDDDGKVTHLIPSGFDITDREEAVARVRLLMEEVNHRSKNMLTMVQAIARQTIRTSPDDFMAKFADRISALARCQDLLVKANWNSVDLEELLRFQLAPFLDAVDAQISLCGPALRVSAEAAQNLSMILNELATNASKYGALSTRSGQIEIAWSVENDADGSPLLGLHWLETGGPAIDGNPGHKGFGSTLIEGVVRTSFGTEVIVEYAADGLKWRLHNAKGAIAS